MWFFNRKSKAQIASDRQQEASRIEVVAHKNATREALAETKHVNDRLNDLLVANGFTLKIYIAAGGQKHKEV